MSSFKKILFCSFLLAFHIVLLQAQTGSTVNGKLIDSTSHQSMGAATVELRFKKDSSVFGSQLANNDGSFSFDNVPLGNYLLTVSFQGYKNVRRNVALTSEVRNARLGNIYVKSNANELAAVTVVAGPPAVAVKSDTTEFGAGQYHVKPNSTTEDLLKKMPGMDIDQNGNVKAQGEQVQRVLVNGKRFFSNDPKMATQNLPSDVIDKIQVFDDLSDQSKFSGFDDGNRVKTINIITKKDNSLGYFGKIVGGGGKVISGNDNSGLYFTGASIHRFKGDQQISIVAQANNTNQQMFTTQDILGSGGRGGQSGTYGSTPTGITRTFAGGINYRDNWGKKTQVYGSYFYNNQRTTYGTTSSQQNFYTDTSLNNTQDQKQLSINNSQNHRMNFNIESNIDSSNAIVFRPNFSTQSSTVSNNSTTDIYNNAHALKSTDTSSSASKYTGYNGTIDLVYRHRFGKPGRTISTDVSWTGSKTNNDGSYKNMIQRYDTVMAPQITNQQYTADSKSYTLSGTASYTEPIAKNQQLELKYNHAYTHTTSNKTTFDYDSTANEGKGGYTILNYSLSNKYINNYTADVVTLGYHLSNQKINFNANAGVQYGHQESINESKTYGPIIRNYTNFYPTANFRYVFSKTSNFRFNYQGRTSQPSISQLQPLTDSSNLLNITAGNPNLKQSFSNSFRLQYFSFNKEKSINMFATVNFSTANNSIVNVVRPLSNGGQYSQPTNMNGSYSLNGYFNFGFPIKSPKSNLNFSSNFSINQTPGLNISRDTSNHSTFVLDTAKNIFHSYSFSETIKWTTNLDSVFDINLFTTPSYTINRYSATKAPNPNYFSQAIAIEGTWYTKSGWMWGNTFNYTYYRGLFNTSVPIWNTSFSKLIFKKKQGEIKLSVYDLLNKNKGISQTSSATSIQQTTTTVLKRYVQLTFTYNIRNFGGKNMPSFFGGRHGGGRRGDGGGFGGGGGGRDF